MLNKRAALFLFLIVSASMAFGQEADLGVAKAGPQQAVPGTDVAYTVTVTNNGPSDAQNVTLSDPVPPGMTFISATQDSGPPFACNATIECTIATLATGQTAAFTFVFRPESTGEFTNVASVTSDTADPNGGNDSSSVVTTAEAADLVVQKSGPEQAAPDSDVAYDITVLNSGPSDAQDVTFTDLVPPGMSLVSATQHDGPAFNCDTSITCTLATLAAGASASFTFVFHIEEGSSFQNTATVTSETADTNEENNQSTVFTVVAMPQADLSVAKTGPTAAGPDTDVTYTITLTNSGPDAATNVVLTDNLPGPLTFVSFVQTSGPPMSCGTSTCTAASFPAGATATFELTGHVPSETPSGTQITNTATASADNDPGEENNVASTTTTISAADVRIEKSGPNTAVAGETVTYTITVTNDGPDAALGVAVDDPQVCPATNCNVGDLGSGQSEVLSGTVTIPPGATSWTNTATVFADTFDPDPSDNSATVNTIVTQLADVRISKTGPAVIVASEDLTYTITVTNDGLSDASNVVVTDTLPAGTTFVSSSCGANPCNLGTLAAGASEVITLTVNVAPDTAGPLVNEVAVTSTTPDPDGTNNTATYQTSVTPAPADLSLTKNAPTVAPASTNITYELIVSNLGPGAAHDVVVTDQLPAETTLVSSPANCTGTTTVTCTFGTVPASTSTSVTLTVTIALDAVGPLVNQAAVDTSSNDPNPANDTDTATTFVGDAPADLSIVKTAEAQAAIPGANATYTIVVTNAGPGEALEVVVIDELPPGTTLVSASPGCTGTETVVCAVGTLAANSSATIVLEVLLPPAPGTVTNTAQVESVTPDPNPGNDAASVAIESHLPFEAVPTLSPAALGVLALTIASIVLVVLRRAS